MEYSKILSMKEKVFDFEKDGTHYKVFVTYKHQRNIYFRYKDDGFHVSATYYARDKIILMGLEKYADKLLEQYNKTIKNYSLEEGYVYLLGVKTPLNNINVKNERELQDYLKNFAFDVITKEVRNYESIMGIDIPYKVTIKDTKRQYGSNSKKTHTLSFQKSLIHYSLPIIDTVVVHELAHEFERNHQKGFYDIVYTYSPSYKTLQRKLKRGIHK